MNSLNEFFASVGSDESEVVSRLGGNPALVVRFVTRFLSDGSFTTLSDALASGDIQTAFRAAHTLKGVCGTLGFQRLYEKASAVTELLRAGSLDSARSAMPDLCAEYNLVIEMIEKLKG